MKIIKYNNIIKIDRGTYSFIRKIPYPYKAALAISNDVEFMSFEFFENLMKFLNSDKQTPLGRGLNLDITSSVFFYSAHSYNFSYFDGISIKNKSSYSSRLLEYIKSGWIDANHAYGDFDRVGGFTRAHAENVVYEISKYNIKIPCFINHGDYFNVQNVGKDGLYHRGDIQGDKAYHSDLFPLIGTKYVWTDSAIIEKNYSKRNFIFFRNRLLPLIKKDSLQDGQKVIIFNRFRGTGLCAPNLSSLKYQIELLDLNKLYKSHELVIIYQHLGVLTKTGGKCVPATVEAIKLRPEVFLAPFYLLAREYHSGKLWLTGTYNLLRYAHMIASIKIFKRGKNDFEILTNEEIEDLDFFQGLTIYINPNEPCKVFYKNHIFNLINNGPDETGKYSVTIPIKKKELIW